MVGRSITISESRLLPVMIAVVLVMTASLTFLSDAPQPLRVIIASVLALASIWPLYRSIRPRWVLRINEGTLCYNDLNSKRMIEINLSRVVNAKVDEVTVLGSDADGG